MKSSMFEDDKRWGNKIRKRWKCNLQENETQNDQRKICKRIEEEEKERKFS